MTTHYHRLDADADRDFLARGETDPFTATPFKPHNVVVLTADGTVLLRETWEALGERYAGSAETRPWGAHAGDGASGPVPGPAPGATPEASGGLTVASGAVASGAAAPRVTAPLPRAPRQHAPPPEMMPDHVRERRAKRPWLLPLLAVLGVAALVAIGLLVVSQLNDEQPVADPIVETDTPEAPDAIAIQEGLIEASLGEGDAEGVGGRYEDRYTFAADSSGRVLSFVLASEDFRPDLVVVGPDGQRYEAEAAGEEGERVRVDNLRGPGRFELRVTSRGPAGAGDYTLRVRQETPIVALAANGQTVRATLGERSELVDGLYRDTYEFPVEAEREYTLAVASSAFGVATTLTDRQGARIQAQRGTGGTLTFTPSDNGRYRLVVSSREKSQRGAYTVNLKAGPKPEVETPEAPRVRALAPNAAPVRDSLSAGQRLTYTFAGQVGDRVRVDARALGFSPSVVLVGPDGRRLPGETSDERAAVSETLATAGTYRVVVSGGEGSGFFQLSLEKTEAPRAADIPRLPGMDAPPPQREQEEYQPQPIDGDGR